MDKVHTPSKYSYPILGNVTSSFTVHSPWESQKQKDGFT